MTDLSKLTFSDDPSCHSCRHVELSPVAEPCESCIHTSRWEPRFVASEEDFDCHTCAHAMKASDEEPCVDCDAFKDVPSHWVRAPDETPKDELPDSNPKTRYGVEKCPLHLVPPNAVQAEAWVMCLGAKKYGAYNWRASKVSASVYYAAAMRHLHAYWNGEDKDAESGQSHLAHVRACMGILIDAEKYNMLNDDRPKS